MTPIERAARAVCRHRCAGMDANWRLYLRDVGLVLEAIREPSDVMLRAALEVDFIGPGENDAAGEWRAMIDALLEEGK